MPMILPSSFTCPTTPVDVAYCDGGCILKNPSPHGGTYGFRYLDAAGNVLAEHGGFFTVAELPPVFVDVENNFCETLAILLAMEGLPPGWVGSMWTDSLNALKRAKNPYSERMSRVPESVKWRLKKARSQRPNMGFGLCSGHPTRKELAAGTSGGLPVSRHNVWCDNRCKQAAQEWSTRLTVSSTAGQPPG